MHPRDKIDFEWIERAIVCARMALHYRLTDKGDQTARKIFCLGPAKTGTSSLHAMFLANGLRSQHSPGNWQVGRFDAFSDRGDYRAFQTYAADYPQSVFVLNTRGLRSYLSSYASHRRRADSENRRPALSVQFFINRILRRNDHMAQVLAHFAGTDRLIVANISRADAMDFVARALGLKPVADLHKHKTVRHRHAQTEANISAAIAALGLTGQEDAPLVFSNLLKSELAKHIHESIPAEQRCFL